MTIDRKTAEEISERFRKASEFCESSLRTVMTNESLGQVEVYGRLVALFMGHSYTNVLAPIWKEFPCLEPEDMKEPYVEPKPTLTEGSQRALRSFLAEAHAAVEFAKKSIPLDDANKYLRFDGLNEIETAVAAIESFLENPRFRDKDKA
jgi:hypothetical protein